MAIRLGTELINSIAKGDSSQHGDAAGAGAFIGTIRLGEEATYSYDPQTYITIPNVTIQVAFQNNNTEAVLTAMPTGGAGAPYTYEWNNANDRSNIIETNATLTVTADGTYEVRVTDSDMNVSDYECAIVDINIGPSVILTGPASVETNQNVALTLTVSDPDHSTEVIWSLTQTGTQITSGSGEISNMAFNATARASAGTDVFVLTATDPFNAAAMDTHNVTVTVPVPRVNARVGNFSGTATLSYNGVDYASGSTVSITRNDRPTVTWSGTVSITRAASGGGSTTIRNSASGAGFTGDTANNANRASGGVGDTVIVNASLTPLARDLRTGTTLTASSGNATAGSWTINIV